MYVAGTSSVMIDVPMRSSTRFLIGVIGAAAVAYSLGISTPARAATRAPAKKVAVKMAPLTRAVWIPYWRKTDGTAEALAHLDALDAVSPFAYSVQVDGSLIDTAKISETPWTELLTAARAKDVRIYPTVMWGNGQQIHDVLSNPDLRAAHVADLTRTIVASTTFDGIDIDYEAKYADTQPYFSLFLKELSKQTRLYKKKLVCTIEARTPLEARYTTVTPAIRATIEYSNDFKKINTYCDRVRIMTYDQRTVDVQLNAAADAAGSLYAPVADPKWVTKVITLAAKDITRSKIQLGIPTYGYVWRVSGVPGAYTYERLRAINYGEALALASSTGAVVQRNRSGELSFTYTATTTPSVVPSGDVLPGLDGGAATTTPLISPSTLRFVSFPDATSIGSLITLAQKAKLGGVVLFKADGGSDPAWWSMLPTR